MTDVAIKHLLELSTKIAPPKTFIVDEDEYQLLGFEHISKAQEATVTALFSRYNTLNIRLAQAPSKEKAERAATLLYNIRMELMCNLTTLPRDVAEKLPMSAQVQLLNAIRGEVGGSAPDDDDDDVTDAAGVDEDL